VNNSTFIFNDIHKPMLGLIGLITTT